MECNKIFVSRILKSANNSLNKYLKRIVNSLIKFTMTMLRNQNPVCKELRFDISQIPRWSSKTGYF